MLATKWKSNKGKGLLLVLLCAMIASTAMCSAYPFFRSQANQRMEDLEAEISREQNEPSLIHLDEEFRRYILSSIYYMNYEMTPDMDAAAYFTQGYDMSRLTVREQEGIKEASARLMRNMRNQYTTMQGIRDFACYAAGPEKCYGSNSDLQAMLDGDKERLSQYYAAALAITYDSRGIPSVRDHWGLDFNEAELLGYLQQASLSRLMEDNGMDTAFYEGEYEYGMEVYETVTVTDENGETYEKEIPVEGVSENNDQLLKLVPAPSIQNASFLFGVYSDGNIVEDYQWRDYWTERSAYARSGYLIGMLAIIGIMGVLALVLQNLPALDLRRSRLFRLPTEVTVWAGAIGFAATGSVVASDFGIYTLTSRLAENFETIGFGSYAGGAATLFVWVFWTCFAFCWYWLAASILPYLTHPIQTCRENLLCFTFCRWIKKLWLRLWHWAMDVEVDENLTRRIWKVVGLNGVVVAALCCIWVGGVVGAIIYTIILYVLVKNKCSQIQGEYKKLLDMTRMISAGDLNTETDEDMGIFNPIRDELAAIRNGFRKAVNDEVRSRNMKTELITNVSHDLKTPLTAIITYVDLLKKEGISKEERKDYVDTLDKKSQRLKVLIEDLFEVSKATSDNIVMNFEEVDLVSLMKQVRLENEDKIKNSELDFRWNLPEEKCVLTLDPQRTFRVMENLVQNILKYSMPHSRVYIDLKDTGLEVTVNLKNMSATEMNFSPEQITERFVRGDLSRNTEGSGLGLAIAQSFIELQKGTFRVETDGDLFKVTICWKR